MATACPDLMALSRFVHNPSAASPRLLTGLLTVLLVLGPALFSAVAPCPRSAPQAVTSAEALPTTAPVDAARTAGASVSPDAGPLVRCIAPLFGRLMQSTTMGVRTLERGSELRSDELSAPALVAFAAPPHVMHAHMARPRALAATPSYQPHALGALRSIVLLL